VVTVLYTYYGGLKAVIWVDVMQMLLYIFGGVVTLWVLVRLVPNGWSGIMSYAADAGKLRVVHLEGGVGSSRWLFTGLIGGAFLSMASHGVDHMIVQRLLAAPSLRSARLALVSSGVLVILQFALFLTVGVGLYAYYQARQFAVPDEIFPRFIVEGLPPGISGLIVAGIMAAMMSTVASSLNSLASAATHDVYAPLAGRVGDEDHLFKVGRRFTLVWAAILIGGAMLFQLVQQGTPIVVVALQIASFTYGGLLGAFMLGVLDARAQQRDVLIGMTTAIVLMAALWALKQFGALAGLGAVGRLLAFDPLWFSLVGSIITLLVGGASARLRPRTV
jgi:Na+/proline symporter